jgi:O-methyltransferase
VTDRHTLLMNAVLHRVAVRVRAALRARGFDVVRHSSEPASFIDPPAVQTIARARPFTMTADESLFSLIGSVRHIVRHDVPGAIVECGVWRGGSMMAAALTLQQLDAADRPLYLYDTFTGMTEPGAADVMLHSEIDAAQLLAETEVGDGANVWCVSPLSEVQAAIASTGYPDELCRFVPGPVEETLPSQLPDRPIALLRLDTDWYESTRHELEHLVPLMSPGAVLIIDDYWHWGGCRKAVDEYLERTGLPILLTRVDITAVGVMPGA